MTPVRSIFLGKAVWGFVAFSHGWTWFFWIVAALVGTTIWHPPALYLFILGGLGVLLGGVAMTCIMHGAEGLRDLAIRIVDPGRITRPWWAAILLFFPLLTLFAGTVARAMGDTQPFDLSGAAQRVAHPATLAAMIAFTFLMGPLPEEIGWRGYLLDHMQTRWNALSAGLFVGLLNWVWHYPLFYLPGYADAFRAIPPGMLQLFFVVLPAVLLYTWVYNNTGRSVLATMLFHFGGNFWGEFFGLSAQAQAVRVVLVIIAVTFIAWWWGPATLRRPSVHAAARGLSSP